MEISEKWKAFAQIVKTQVKEQCRQIEMAGHYAKGVEDDAATRDNPAHDNVVHDNSPHGAASSYEEELRQWKEGWLAAEKEKYRLFLNGEKSRHIMECKLECCNLERECEEALFSQVEKMLVQFRTTDSYKRRMMEWISEVTEFAEGQKMEVELSPSDEALLPILAEQTENSLVLSREEFLGGIRCRIFASSRYLDESFATKLQRIREEWNGWQ